MNSNQQEFFESLVSNQKKLSREGIEYWHLYSDFGTWQFWAVLLMLICPVIVLYFVIDRKKVFIIGFFGFAVHVLFAYTDACGIRLGLWGYPYQLIPFIPSLSLDAAIIPIAIMIVFQWTLNHHKNFYLYSFLTALLFGFGFKPLLVSIGLFEKYQWVNYFYIFLIYLVLYWLGHLLTTIFFRLQDSQKEKEV